MRPYLTIVAALATVTGLSWPAEIDRELAILQQGEWESWRVPDAACRQLVERGPAAVEPICDALAANPSLRFLSWAKAALYGIAYAARDDAGRQTQVLQALSLVLSDRQRPARVRSLAAELLGRLGHADAAQPLIDALSEPGVRTSAAQALGILGVREATPALQDLLRQPLGSEARVACIEALGKVAGQSLVDVLKPFIRSNDRRIQFAAIDAIAELSGDAAFRVLSTVVNGDDTEAARRAARAMLRCCRAMVNAGDIRPLLAAGDRACQGCHAQVFADYEQSAHRRKTQMMCDECHGEGIKHMEDYGRTPPDKPTPKRLMPQLCGNCHFAVKSYIDAGYGPTNTQLDHRFRWRSPWRFFARQCVYRSWIPLVFAMPLAAWVAYRRLKRSTWARGTR